MNKTFQLIIVMAAVLSNSLSYGENTTSTVDCREFEKIIQITRPLTILDVRTPEEYQQGHIPNAVNIDFNREDFVSNVKKEVPSGNSIALYCRGGFRSAKALDSLRENDYSLYDLKGGILEWEKAQLPITTGNIDIYFTQDGKALQIQPLIHASIRMNYDNKEIEIDPVATLGNRHTDYSKFPKSDLILVTHEHHDHLDPNAIKTLLKPDTVVVTNPNSAHILGFGEIMKNGDKKTIDGIEIEAVPAYNVSQDRLQFHPEGRDNGYVLNIGGLRIYIAGDTEVIPEMSNLKDIDIAFLPCNLPYTMTPEQLIEAAKIIRPKVLYPYHFGTTDLSSITPALAPEGIYVRICPFDP